MRISLFNNFGAKNSVPVFAAVEQGLKSLGHNVVKHDLNADVAVIWSMLWQGRMAGNRSVWAHYQRHQKPVIVLEVGMLKRGYTWKLGLNGTGLRSYPTDQLNPNRPAELGLTLSPWRESGSNILVAVQRTDSEQWQSQSKNWLENTIVTLRQHTQRPIIIRPHPRQVLTETYGCQIQQPQRLPNTYDDFNFLDSLDDIWAVVNCNSGPGVQATISGIPAFVGTDSLASPVANTNLADIENPVRPDRTGWLVNLAHTEWTIDELSSGYPMLRILCYY